MFVIYAHTNTVNGTQYVGQTEYNASCKTPERAIVDRWRKGTGYPRCWALAGAISKYGAHAFSSEVLEVVSDRAAMNEAEPRWIAKLGTLKPGGYNLNLGGNAKGLHEETRKRISIGVQRHWDSLPQERRGDRMRKAWARLTPEQRSEWALSAITSQTPEQLRARMKNAKAAWTPVQTSVRMREVWAARGLAERKENGRKSHANIDRAKANVAIRAGIEAMGPERRSARGRKSWAAASDEGRANAVLNLKPQHDPVVCRERATRVWATKSKEERRAIKLRAWETRRAKLASGELKPQENHLKAYWASLSDEERALLYAKSQKTRADNKAVCNDVKVSEVA